MGKMSGPFFLFDRDVISEDIRDDFQGNVIDMENGREFRTIFMAKSLSKFLFFLVKFIPFGEVQ
jgi:hypothetical protein